MYNQEYVNFGVQFCTNSEILTSRHTPSVANPIDQG